MIPNPELPNFKKFLTRHNMIKINDVQIPTKGTGKYFGLKCLPFEINKESKSSPEFKWVVKDSVIQENNGEQIEYPGQTILEGTLFMTEQDYSLWTGSDSYAIDWALQKLNLSESQ